MQKTYKGKRAAHYIARAKLAVSEAGIYELFYGNDVILYKSNYGNSVVLYGAGGFLAELELTSRKSTKALDRLDDYRWIRNNQ